MRYVIIAAIMGLSTVSAQADIFTYTCRVNGKSLTVKIDDTKNILKWRDKIYQIKVEDSCTKFGWRAERKGDSFNFCTATQGYADFHEGSKLIQCDQDR